MNRPKRTKRSEGRNKVLKPKELLDHFDQLFDSEDDYDWSSDEYVQARSDNETGNFPHSSQILVPTNSCIYWDWFITDSSEDSIWKCEMHRSSNNENGENLVQIYDNLPTGMNKRL